MKKNPRPTASSIAQQRALWARMRADWEQSSIGLRLLGKRHGITSLTTIRRHRDNPKDPWKRDQAAITVKLVTTAAIDRLYLAGGRRAPPGLSAQEIEAPDEAAEACRDLHAAILPLLPPVGLEKEKKRQQTVLPHGISPETDQTRMPSYRGSDTPEPQPIDDPSPWGEETLRPLPTGEPEALPPAAFRRVVDRRWGNGRASARRRPVERAGGPEGGQCSCCTGPTSAPGQLIAATFGASTTPGAAGRPWRGGKPKVEKRAVQTRSARTYDPVCDDPAGPRNEHDMTGPIGDAACGQSWRVEEGRAPSPTQSLSSIRKDAAAEQVDLADAMIHVVWLLLERLKTAIGAVDELERDAAIDALIVARGDTLTSVLTATERLLAGAVKLKRLALGMDLPREPVPPEPSPPDPKIRKLLESLDEQGLLTLRKVALDASRALGQHPAH